MTYAINQEVIYVGTDYSSDPRALAHGIIVPRPGQVYTIRDTTIHRLEGACYLLNEIKNRITDTWDMGPTEEGGWIRHRYLKPVEKRKTDISALESLLDTKSHKKLVGA